VLRISDCGLRIAIVDWASPIRNNRSPQSTNPQSAIAIEINPQPQSEIRNTRYLGICFATFSTSSRRAADSRSDLEICLGVAAPTISSVMIVSAALFQPSMPPPP
jgi:hypothetical protein